MPVSGHAAENVAIIILAAGKGTRMKSDQAKVLHQIAGRPMIDYVVATAREVAPDNVILVVGHQADRVKSVVDPRSGIRFALQNPQLGTGHAVLCAFPMIGPEIEHVVVLCGDVPLLRSATVIDLIDDHSRAGRRLSLLAVETGEPSGYGRIVYDRQRRVSAIVEEADATEAQKRIRTINAGIYCIEKAFLETALPLIGSDNAQGEMYLTDIVGIAHRDHQTVGVMVGGDRQEVLGVNTVAELKAVESLMQAKNT